MFLFFLKYSVFQNCVSRIQMPSGTGTQTVVPVPMPCDQCPASTAALPCRVFDVPHPTGVSSSPKSMTMVQGMFSAGHLDIALQISHPLIFVHSDTSELSGWSVTFRKISGTCSICPNSDGLFDLLLNCDYIYPFLSLPNSFFVQLFSVKDKPH